jgi:hypothetical protein
MRIRIRLFTFIWIQILLLIKVMQIGNHWSTDPPGLHFEPLKLLNVYFNADSDSVPAFYLNADPDPASQDNADPDPLHCRKYIPFDLHKQFEEVWEGLETTLPLLPSKS